MNAMTERGPIPPLLIGVWVLVYSYEQHIETGKSSITYGPMALKLIYVTKEWMRFKTESGGYLWLHRHIDTMHIVEVLETDISH